MVHHFGRFTHVAALSTMPLAVASGAALANGTRTQPNNVDPDTGTCTSIGTQIVFYYGVSSGNCTSPHWNGGGNYKLCTDAPGSHAGNTYDARFRHDRTFQSDETIREIVPYFNSPRLCSTAFGTSSDSSYHTDAAWPYISGAGGGANGYSRGEAQ